MGENDAWGEVAFAATPRGRVEYARAGSGSAVLVVHGVPGSWRQAFTLGEDLASTHTVVAPSRPGYGRTPLSSGRTYDEQADLYAALLDEIGIERVVVVGASGGGPSSVAFARRHADRTDGLVLACAMTPDLIRVRLPLRLLTLPVLGEAVAWLDRTIGARRLGDPRAIDARIAKDFTRDEQQRIAADPPTRAALIAFARTHLDAPAGLAGMRNDLAQVRHAKQHGPPAAPSGVPTLILHGDADEAVPMLHALHHRDAIAGALLETYRDAGHVFFVTRRAEASERIRVFAAEAARTAPETEPRVRRSRT